MINHPGVPPTTPEPPRPLAGYVRGGNVPSWRRHPVQSFLRLLGTVVELAVYRRPPAGGHVYVPPVRCARCCGAVAFASRGYACPHCGHDTGRPYLRVVS